MAQFNGNGNYNQNNSSKNANNTTYYSGLRIRNYTDNNAINITYSAGLMHIGIAVPDENNRFQNEIQASLTPKKAAIIVDQLPMFEAGEEGVFGTVLGMSEVQTAIGFQYVNDNRCLRIAKVDKDGKITATKTFTFQKGVDASYRWSDFEKMKFTKDYNDDIDYKMLKSALIDFSRNMSGALAYGGLYMNRYQENSISTRISAICGKLGISTGGNSNGGNRNYGGGYFNDNSSANTTSQHRSYDEISSMIDDDDD